MNDHRWPVREHLKYDRNNFWVRIFGASAYVGLTEYGQWQIGDIMYLDIDPVGESKTRGEKFGSVESGKWVGSLVAPVSGIILERNLLALEHPSYINSSPYDEGWLVRIELSSSESEAAFLDHREYAAVIKEQIDDELRQCLLFGKGNRDK